MRVAFVDYVCDPAKPGATGLSDLVWDLAGRLARLGDEVHVVAPYTVDTVPDAAVQVHRFPIPPIGYRNILGHTLIILAACRRLAALGRFDVIHVPEYVSAAFLTTFFRGTPVVFTEPGNIYERVARGNPYDPVTTVVYKLAARRTAATCARLVATSEAMAKWWEWTGVSQDRICRVPLGIDARLFQRVPNARSALGLTPDPPLLLYAARLSRENGIDVALRAIPRIQQAIGPVQFHILGDGPERESLRQLSESLGIDHLVTWHGWVDFNLLPTYYSAADAFVFAGRSGGTPRVMIQAMACQAPIVASAIGGIVDHVEPEKTGLLFPSGDHAALAAQVCRVLSDRALAAGLGQSGERYVRDTLDWDRLVRRIREDVYEGVAHPRPELSGDREVIEGTGRPEVDPASLVAHYDEWAPAMENVSHFYDWATDCIGKQRVDKGLPLVDVGCGTGALLSRLADQGFTNLTGVDFSPACLALAAARAPGAELVKRDIVAGPLPERYRVALITTVIDFVADPAEALANVRNSLSDDGLLFLTIRNRWAYFPWYHLRGAERALRRLPWLRHWFLWFTTPLALRRNDQPLEKIYSPPEMRRMLVRGGFSIVSEHGASILPMLWIPGVRPLLSVLTRLDRVMWKRPANPLCFSYLFVCRKKSL